MTTTTTPNYEHKTIEEKWQQAWKQHNNWAAEPNHDRPKYYVLDMLPYPSGRLHMGHIRNYSIFHFEGKLFAYFEYHGPEPEFEERMREIARAPRMREWWDVMDPMQVPVEGRDPGGWWANMEEVFHTE